MGSFVLTDLSEKRNLVLVVYHEAIISREKESPVFHRVTNEVLLILPG